VGITQYEAEIVTDSMANFGRLQDLKAGLSSQRGLLNCLVGLILLLQAAGIENTCVIDKWMSMSISACVMCLNGCVTQIVPYNKQEGTVLY
jgi:hypothetical protein